MTSSIYSTASFHYETHGLNFTFIQKILLNTFQEERKYERVKSIFGKHKNVRQKCQKIFTETGFSKCDVKFLFCFIIFYCKSILIAVKNLTFEFSVEIIKRLNICWDF